MTFQAIVLILKNLPWKYIAAGAIVVALFATMFTLKSQRDIARAERDAAIAQLEAQKVNYEMCRANREALQDSINDMNDRIRDIAAEKASLDEDLAKALVKARELSAAKRKLADVSDKYNRLRMQSEHMTVCETYESALIALSGGVQ